MERQYIKIGAAAEIMGVHRNTLLKWEETGELLPHHKSQSGTRYYAVADLMGIRPEDSPTVGYARVSSQDQKADLDTQHAALEAYCAAKGWRTYIIRDMGSGMNYRKKGLQELLELILRRKMRRLVLTHKDRLLRFGAELVFALCEMQQIEVVLIHTSDDLSFEEGLAQDVLEIVAVFSARLYGSRSRKNKKLLDSLTDGEIVESAKQLSLLSG